MQQTGGRVVEAPAGPGEDFSGLRVYHIADPNHGGAGSPDSLTPPRIARWLWQSIGPGVTWESGGVHDDDLRSGFPGRGTDGLDASTFHAEDGVAEDSAGPAGPTPSHPGSRTGRIGERAAVCPGSRAVRFARRSRNSGILSCGPSLRRLCRPRTWSSVWRSLCPRHPRGIIRGPRSRPRPPLPSGSK